MAKCKDVMTREPVAVEPGDSVTRVATLMKQEDVGSVPVVESGAARGLVGIVTDRDLVVKVLAGGRPVDQAKVNDAMTPDPVSCREDDDVEKAIALMKEHQVRRIPVVDANGALAGIIAQADIATRIDLDRKTGELVEAISESNVSRR